MFLYLPLLFWWRPSIWSYQTSCERNHRIEQLYNNNFGHFRKKSEEFKEICEKNSYLRPWVWFPKDSKGLVFRLAGVVIFFLEGLLSDVFELIFIYIILKVSRASDFFNFPFLYLFSPSFAIEKMADCSLKFFMMTVEFDNRLPTN